MKKLMTALALAATVATTAVAFGAVAPTINPETALSSLALLGGENGHGSGFFKSPTEIVTAKHVAIELNYLSTVQDYKGRSYKIVKILDTDDDVAVITVDRPAPEDVKPAVIDCKMPALLEPSFALGHPLEMHDIMTLGHVSGTEQSKSTDGLLRVIIDNAAGPGASGGPVMNDQGHVWGILTAVELAQASEDDTFNTGLTYALPLILIPQLCKVEKPTEGIPTSE